MSPREVSSVDNSALPRRWFCDLAGPGLPLTPLRLHQDQSLFLSQPRFPRLRFGLALPLEMLYQRPHRGHGTGKCQLPLFPTRPFPHLALGGADALPATLSSAEIQAAWAGPVADCVARLSPAWRSTGSLSHQQ
jgi:hypothetical protein